MSPNPTATHRCRCRLIFPVGGLRCSLASEDSSQIPSFMRRIAVGSVGDSDFCFAQFEEKAWHQTLYHEVGAM